MRSEQEDADDAVIGLRRGDEPLYQEPCLRFLHGGHDVIGAREIYAELLAAGERRVDNARL
jgi:hypothetical protein